VDAGTGEQEWAFETGSPVHSSPTVVDGTVYVGSGNIYDGALYAVDAETGEQQWAFDTGAWVYSSPTVVDGTVYVGSRDDNLYAVDAETGEEEWAFQTGHAVRSSPTVVDGTVYVGSRYPDETLYAVDAGTGEEEWAFETGGEVNSPPTVVDDPESGDSIGSRVMLGTLGHHSDWRYAGQSIDIVESGRGTANQTNATNVSGENENNGGMETSAMLAVGGGGVGLSLLAAYYGLARRSDDAADEAGSDDGGDPGDTPAAGPSPGETPSNTETPATERVDDHLDTAKRRLNSAREPYESGDYDSALNHCENAIDAAKQAREVARDNAPDRVADAETAIEDVTQLREQIEEERETRQEAVARLDDIETTLDTAEDALADGDDCEALEKLDSVPATLAETDDPLEAHDFADLAQHRDALETRYERLQQEAKDALTDIPAEIPTTARRDLTYDDIEKGEVIGSGGNATVSRARTADGAVEFALKEPQMSGTLSTAVVDQMLDEAETWQQLDDHDHIVSVLDYGSEPLPWIAMEYMDAGHLGERAAEMETAQKLWTALSVTEGVYHAHRRGVVHRDLKPENILFRRVEDAWDAPKVADWGLSKHLLEHSKSRDGLTVEYAAPEQFSESTETDDRTDIYQLGAVFYELFTGQPPFEGEMFVVMEQIKTEEPTPPSEIADVPAGLDEVVLTALAKDPEDRYSDVVYLRDALEDLTEL
jgi:tetratricopeptide (TPR) repeat protein